MTNVEWCNLLMVFMMLLGSYIPVNLCIGRRTETLLAIYLSTFIFRALCICGAFLNGARNELLCGIVLAVVTEVSLLVMMSVAAERAEVLA